MIKKIQRRFIAIAMISMILVLGLILAIINYANYEKINEYADDILEILIENDGNFPKFDKNKPPHLSPESPFVTRYFSVFFDNNGSVYASNTGNIAAISRVEATDYALVAYNSNKSSGFIDSYKYEISDDDDGHLIVFLDCSKELNTFYTFLNSSIWLSVLGLIAVYILVYFLSKIAIKPIAESYEKQKRFITDASHEIKTPLTIIQANTEMLETVLGQNKYINSTIKQVHRLTGLTNQLLNLSKMDEKSQAMTFTNINLSNIIIEQIFNFESLATKENKNIITDIQDNIELYADYNDILELINILLDNALKYSDANSNIVVNLTKHNKRIYLKVENQASGLLKGPHNELLGRFYRIDDSRSKASGGFGLGLAMANAIVNKQNGKIDIYSPYDNYLIVKVKF